MNIASKSIIPASCRYEQVTEAKKSYNDLKTRWIEKELDRLVALRAAGVSYKECTIYFPRTATACKSAVEYHNLYAAIAHKRAILIDRATR
ncbi:MAG: hypothetical protein ACI9RI_000869 [Oceanospirillaceae bacterium]|jgi:hypothetical protein